MSIEIPVIFSVNQALTKQIEKFTYEQWHLYIDDWPPSLLCLVNITLQREDSIEFWLRVIAAMQFEEQLKLQILLLATVDDSVYDLLLDAIDDRLAIIGPYIRPEHFSILSEV